MFCIAAFVILLIISIFSAKYRNMAKKAWGCVAHRLTLRPCDTNFKQELKAKLLAHVAVRKPQYLKAASIAIEVAAFMVVALTVWSLYVVVKSGLNLYVYGTCNPSNAESCSIGAEACSISSAKPSFVSSVKDFELHTWVANEAKDFGETLAALPTRLQNWKAEDYLPANASYQKPFDANKPTALDVIDPGCQYCKALYKNQEAAKLADRYNLTYIAYPIPNPDNPKLYKFKNSFVIASYLEATKIKPLENAAKPADWQILNRIFTEKDTTGYIYQISFNTVLSNHDAKLLLQQWLKEFGYSDAQIIEIRQLADSQKVKDIIETNRRIVDDKIKTVKIPTLIKDGRRHTGVVEAHDL